MVINLCKFETFFQRIWKICPFGFSELRMLLLVVPENDHFLWYIYLQVKISDILKCWKQADTQSHNIKIIHSRLFFGFSLKLNQEKLGSEKTEMQRHYVMVCTEQQYHDVEFTPSLYYNTELCNLF